MAFAEAVRAAVAVLREVRPQVVITYDPDGEYGHPDHVMTHRVAMAAVEAAADPAYAAIDGAPPWQVAKVYWTACAALGPAARCRGVARGRHPVQSPTRTNSPSASLTRQITTAIRNLGWGEAKEAAMRAHATQISVDGPFFALSNRLGREVLETEYVPSRARRARRCPRRAGPRGRPVRRDMTATPNTGATAPPPDPRWVAPVGVVLCVLCAALAALIEVTLVPLYVGSVIVPVTLLLTAATSVALPVLARRMVDGSAAVLATFAPFVAWVVTYFVLAAQRSEGDVLLTGSGAAGVVGLVLLAVGAITGITTAAVVAFRGPAAGTAPPAPRTGSGSRGGASSPVR